MGNSSSGVDNEPDLSDGELSDDDGGGAGSSVRIKDADTTDFSGIADENRLDLGFLFSQERLKAAALRIKEELPVNVLQTHQAHILSWLEDRVARNEESVSVSQFCDMLVDRGVGRLEAMRAFEKFDCDGSGSAEVQSMIQTVNSLANVYGGSGIVSNEGEVAYCSKSMQSCPLLPGFVDVFTDADSSSRQATKIFNFYLRNRAAASAFVYPLLDSFHDTANMRESVVKNYFEAVSPDDGGDGVDSTTTTGEGVRLVLKPYSAIEVSTNAGATDKLTDGDAGTFWQSDGSARSHWIRVRMKPNVAVKQLFIYVSSSDQSYMPSDLTIAVGRSSQSLHNIRDIRIPNFVNGPVLLLENMKSYFPFVQIFIKRCQNDGCDTRIRLLKVVGCRLTKEQQVSVSDATALWFVRLVALTASACLPTVPKLHELFLQHTREALGNIPPLSLTSGSSERPPFATDSVLNEVGQFVEQINGCDSASQTVVPCPTENYDQLASGLYVQLAFTLARGLLPQIARCLTRLLDHRSIKLRAGGLLYSLENAKMRFLKRRARQLALTMASCDGGADNSNLSREATTGAAATTAGESLPADSDDNVANGDAVTVQPSHVLTVADWAAPNRPYLTQPGKKNLNMIFKAADYMQLTKVKIKVEKGGRGARCGLVFLLEDSTSDFYPESIVKRYERYDSWTEADYLALRSVPMASSGPAAFFSIPDDWDEADVPLSIYSTCQYVLLKFLRPRCESTDRIGIIAVRFYGYNRSKDFKVETEESVRKLSDVTKDSELAPCEIVSSVLSFLLAVLRSQDFGGAKKGSQSPAGLDISSVSVKCLWDLYNAAPAPFGDCESSAIQLKCLHLMHAVFAHSPSDFDEEDATKQMFSYFCTRIDAPQGTSGDTTAVMSKIILDGAKVFFPHEKTRLDQLLKMMNTTNNASPAALSSTVVFESLCRFYSTVDPSGLLSLPKLGAPKPYADTHFVGIMDVMLSATLRDFSLCCSGRTCRPSPALFRLLCCLQTTLVCWVRAALARGSATAVDSGWTTVAESALTKYVELLSSYNVKAFDLLYEMDESAVLSILKAEGDNNFFKVTRQMVTIMLSLASKLGDNALDQILGSLMPIANRLDQLSVRWPEAFLKPESEQWCTANASKAVVLRVWEEESAHSYHNNQHLTRMYSSPGASLMVVEFDSRCETERRYDYLEFTDATGTKTRFEHKVGTEKWPLRVEFRGSKLHFLFHSDPSNNEWGYKFKVTAYGSPEVAFCWPFDLQLSLAKLIGRTCSRLLACCTATRAAGEQAETESAEAALLKSELWRTLFRAGYTPATLEHSLSGIHVTCLEDGKNFLLALVDTPEEAYIVSFVQRCQERCKGRLSYGGEVADQVVLSIFSALLWHTPQLREDVEKYVASGYAPSQLTDGIFLAYTVAEGLRPQLVAARQKQQEKSCQQAQHDILKEIAQKASFLLKFACLTRMQLRTEVHRSGLKSAKLRRHVGHLSADVEVIWKLDGTSFERFPTFRFILEFILESSWTMENVTKVIQERRSKAEAVSHAYFHIYSYLNLSSGSGRGIFEIENVVLLMELLSAQKDMPRHYLDMLDGCGLHLESNVRKNFYEFLRCLIQSVVSVRRSQLSGSMLATYDVILSCVLHLLAVDWRPYDLTFVEEVQIPLFLLNVTRDTVAVLKAVKHETSESDELADHRQAMHLLKDRAQLNQQLDTTRSQTDTDPTKEFKMFVAKYCDLLQVETMCNGCGNSLPARRYRCLQCIDTDLCSDCFAGAIQPLSCHKEDHEFVHFMFKCNHCRGFISGERVHCEECDDFDLCYGCFKSYEDDSASWSAAGHQASHKMTRYFQMRFKLSGNSSSCMAAYIHQCAWLEYIQLTLSLAGIVWCKEPALCTLLRDDSSYSDSAVRLLMSCVDLVTSCLKQAAATSPLTVQSGDSGSETADQAVVPDPELEKQEAFVQQFQERVMGLLGIMVIHEGQSNGGHVMSSFFNTADFLKLLILIASGYGTNCEPLTQHLAVGLAGQLLTKSSADLQAADVAAEEAKQLLRDARRNVAEPEESVSANELTSTGASTVRYFVRLAMLCVHREQDMDWCASVVHTMRLLLAHPQWRPQITAFVKSSLGRALSLVDSEVIIANLVMAGFPQILFPGMRVDYLDVATEDKKGVVQRHFGDKMQSVVIDIKTRKRHMVSPGHLQPTDILIFPFDESLLLKVTDYIEQSVWQLWKGQQGRLTLNQLWALGLSIKAFNQAMCANSACAAAAHADCVDNRGGDTNGSGVTCCSVPNELQQRLVPVLVHLASLSTSFNQQWIVADVEVLAAILYARRADFTMKRERSADRVLLSKPATAQSSAETGVAGENVPNLSPHVTKSSSAVPLTPLNEGSSPARSVADLVAVEEPFEESGLSGLMSGLPTADSSRGIARFRRMESAKLLRAELSTEADQAPADSPPATPCDNAPPVVAATASTSSCSDTSLTSRAVQACMAVCILHARHTLLSVLSQWPDDCRIPLKNALLPDGQDMTKFLSVLDLLNSSHDDSMFQQVVAKLMSCCEEDYLLAVAITAATFMEDEGAATRVFESSHERSSNPAVPKTKVTIPGATHLTIKFDTRCATEEDANRLFISTTDDLSSEKAHTLSGCSGSCWQDIELPGDTFYYRYAVDSEDSTLWGWKFTVTSQPGRFETGHIILRHLLKNKELARLLPMAELWARLIAVVCCHTGEQRLKALQLLLLIMKTQGELTQSRGDAPPTTAWLDLHSLRPLWTLYNGVLNKSGTHGPCLAPLVRALTELFLCVEDLVLKCGRDIEYAAILASKSQILALVQEGVSNIRALSAVIGYTNKANNPAVTAEDSPTPTSVSCIQTVGKLVLQACDRRLSAV